MNRKKPAGTSAPSGDTTTAAQIDIAPTVLELAGFAVPNIFMGHNLLRVHTADSTSVPEPLAGLSLGAYSGYAAIGLNGWFLSANEKCFEQYKDYVCRDIELCKGKVVLQLDQTEFDTGMDRPYLYLWTDENGNEKYVTVSDSFLTENKLDVGSEWTKNP